MYISRCRYPEDTASQDTGGYPEDTGYPQDTGLYPEDTPHVPGRQHVRFQMTSGVWGWGLGSCVWELVGSMILPYCVDLCCSGAQYPIIGYGNW